MTANRHCCNRICRLRAGSYDMCHVIERRRKRGRSQLRLTGSQRSPILARN